MKRIPLRHSIPFIVLAAAMITAPSFALQDKVPDITGKIDFNTLKPILEQGTVVLIHKVTVGEPQFCTGIAMMNETRRKVWDTVVDFDQYGQFVPNAKRVWVVDEPAPETRIVGYHVKFNVVGPLGVNIIYTLEQHFNPFRSIWGIPAKEGEGVFRDVRYHETFLPVDADRTIFTYTTYADLKSFSRLGKLFLNAFPEMETPAMIAVDTLFPESLKEKIDGSRLISGLQRGDLETVEVPSFEGFDLERLRPVLENYRFVVTHYPDAAGLRFISSLCVIDRPAEEVYRVVRDFDQYPEFMPFVLKSAVSDLGEKGWAVDYETNIKMIFNIELAYRMLYREVGPFEFCWEIDHDLPHDVEGDWGRIKVIPLGEDASIFLSTQYVDLGSGSFILRALANRIIAFDLGMRVALAEVNMSMFKKRVEEVK